MLYSKFLNKVVLLVVILFCVFIIENTSVYCSNGNACNEFPGFPTLPVEPENSFDYLAFGTTF